MEDHKTTYTKVLNQFEMYYFIGSDEWRQNKQDKNIKLITEKAIITLSNYDNKFIKLTNFVYIYTPKQLNITKY